MGVNLVRAGRLCALAFMLSPLLAAQNNGSPGADGTQLGRQGRNDNGANNGVTDDNNPSVQAKRDKAFVKKVSESGFAEIQLGQLAAQKGGSDVLKQLGQKMVDDHTALDASQQPSADAMGVKSAMKLSKKNQAKYDRLNGLSGTDFDKEYLACMVKDHQKDLRLFEDENATVANPDLKSAVEKGLQVIQEHTKMVEQLYAAKKG